MSKVSLEANPQADAHHPNPYLHVIEAVPVDGEYWPRCSCGRWMGLPHQTYQSAMSVTCGIESAELDSLRTLHLFRRACIRACGGER